MLCYTDWALVSCNTHEFVSSSFGQNYNITCAYCSYGRNLECNLCSRSFRYVRQRMGRNKLKSFGPLICLMARLMNVRTGSFFFKALGITLLFMAGFPDDIVQKETKYRNLDLLQKYYRYVN